MYSYFKCDVPKFNKYIATFHRIAHTLSREELDCVKTALVLSRQELQCSASEALDADSELQAALVYYKELTTKRTKITHSGEHQNAQHCRQ